jgi:2-keto-4-pentenoate hydratase
MNEDTRLEASALLLDATRLAKPVEPLSEAYPGFTVDDAYAVQLGQVKAWRDEGRTVVGHKVGLTSLAMQRQLGVDQPDFGHLFADMRYSGVAEVERFISPKVEPEIAFVLARPLRGPVTVEEAVAAVGYVQPALEIIDSRIRDWQIGLADTIADNASSGGFVLGEQQTELADIDLARVDCVLTMDGSGAGTGTGAAVMGSPVNALVWLVNTLGERGVGLEAGHIVLPGSITAAVPVKAGSVVSAVFSGLGTVSVQFAGRQL